MPVTIAGKRVDGRTIVLDQPLPKGQNEVLVRLIQDPAGQGIRFWHQGLQPAKSGRTCPRSFVSIIAIAAPIAARSEAQMKGLTILYFPVVA